VFDFGSTGIPAAAPPAPVTALGGALTGVTGNTRVSREGVHAEGPVAGSTPQSGGFGGVPPTAIGAAPAGRPADGYVINDPRYADDATAWSTMDDMVWGDDDSPPPVIGGTAVA
jgi:hypothetical protein